MHEDFIMPSRGIAIFIHPIIIRVDSQGRRDRNSLVNPPPHSLTIRTLKIGMLLICCQWAFVRLRHIGRPYIILIKLYHAVA